MAARIKGKVAWFNATKGYGFIDVVGREKQVFVHYSGISSKHKLNGQRNLVEGQDVEFEIVQGTQGEQAENVVILD